MSARPGCTRTGERRTFIVPADVPNRMTTAQLPEGDRARGTVRVRLWDPDGKLRVDEPRMPVDDEGVFPIPLPPEPEAGEWTIARGHLIRSMRLLPMQPGAC